MITRKTKEINGIKKLVVMFFITIEALVFVVLLPLAAREAKAAESAGFYRNLINRERIGEIREYDCSQLTTEILETRGDDLIIEKIIGVCLDSKGNGQILNSADPNYDYISYRGVPGVHKGDVIMTLCIYNPGNGYVDDVADRFDYIIDRSN